MLVFIVVTILLQTTPSMLSLAHVVVVVAVGVVVAFVTSDPLDLIRSWTDAPPRSIDRNRTDHTTLGSSIPSPEADSICNGTVIRCLGHVSEVQWTSATDISMYRHPVVVRGVGKQLGGVFDVEQLVRMSNVSVLPSPAAVRGSDTTT